MRVLVVGAGAVGSPGGTARNKPHVYATPERLSLNHWALTGSTSLRENCVGEDCWGDRTTVPNVNLGDLPTEFPDGVPKADELPRWPFRNPLK